MSKKKVLIISLSLLSIILTVATLIFISRLKSVEVFEQQDFITEAELFDGEKVYSIKGSSDGKLYLYINGQKTEDLGYYNTLKAALQLYDTASVDDKDISSNKMLMDLTWKADLVDSSRHVNKLFREGWSLIRRFNCPTYIELFMQKEGVIKRIIIAPSFLMQGDLVEESKLPDLNTYFDNYNIKYEFN